MSTAVPNMGSNLPVNGPPHMGSDLRDSQRATEVESKTLATKNCKEDTERDLYQ